MVEVTTEFKLSTETLFLAQIIVDKVLEIDKALGKGELQLLGIVAIQIASKYTDVYTPPVSEFAFISDGTYTTRQIIEMEKLVWGDRLGYTVSFPTAIPFLERFLQVVCESIDVESNLLSYHANFYCGSTLPIFSFSLFTPSTVALCSVLLALYTLNHDPWPAILKFHSEEEWTNPQFQRCLQRLQDCVITPPYPTLNAISAKYPPQTLQPVPTEQIKI